MKQRRSRVFRGITKCRSIKSHLLSSASGYNHDDNWTAYCAIVNKFCTETQYPPDSRAYVRRCNFKPADSLGVCFCCRSFPGFSLCKRSIRRNATFSCVITIRGLNATHCLIKETTKVPLCYRCQNGIDQWHARTETSFSSWSKSWKLTGIYVSLVKSLQAIKISRRSLSGYFLFLHPNISMWNPTTPSKTKPFWNTVCSKTGTARSFA